MGDLLSAAGLLLAVASVLYGLWYTEIVAAAQTTVPPFAEDRKKPRKHVEQVLYRRAIPVATGASLVALTFLPVSVVIIVRSIQHVARTGWSAVADYDAVATSLCIVEVFAIVLTFHTWMLTFDVVHRMKELGKPT